MRRNVRRLTREVHGGIKPAPPPPASVAPTPPPLPPTVSTPKSSASASSPVSVSGPSPSAIPTTVSSTSLSTALPLSGGVLRQGEAGIGAAGDVGCDGGGGGGGVTKCADKGVSKEKGAFRKKGRPRKATGLAGERGTFWESFLAFLRWRQLSADVYEIVGLWILFYVQMKRLDHALLYKLLDVKQK